MGYYMRGDYYSPYHRGDYYRGDFFGGLVGGIAGAVKGFATGGFTGLVTGAISGANTGSRGPAPPPGAPNLGPLGKIPLAPFPGAPTTQGFVNAAVAAGQPPGAHVRGYHISKRTGKLVKNRHMNVANPRALSRAARRAHGFLRLSKRFVRYYQPKAHKGHAYIGRKRRSR